MSEQELVEIKPGDTVVDYDRQWHSVNVHKVVAVKPKTYTYEYRYTSRDGAHGMERRRDRSSVVFAGSDDAAKALAQRLESSIGQRSHAIRQAEQQMRDRNAKLIAEARAVVTA